MLHRLRHSLTYANVMATTAVFLGLAGGAYAVSGIPDANGALHGCVSKKTGALRVVTSAGSCHGTKRQNGRIIDPGEFAIAWNSRGVQGQQGLTGLAGPQGIQGIQGLQGNQGTPGLSGATNVVVRAVTITGLVGGSQTVQCNPGERAVGGGANPAGFPSSDRLLASAPTVTMDTPAGDGTTPTGWITGIANASATDTTFYAVCVSP